jgi:spermidine synthase
MVSNKKKRPPKKCQNTTFDKNSFNLVGSLIGVVAMLVMGQCWATPLVWFGSALCLALYLFSGSRRAILASALMALICLMTLGSFATLGIEYIYSPYQVLEKRVQLADGVIQIQAANNYYQRVVDLSAAGQTNPFKKRIAQYYEMPFRFKPNPDQVLVIGAGTGNDVAAALRCGAKHVDAVEIDPAIAKLGGEFHPENPYGSDKVSLIVDDARQYLKKTKKHYDVIVFGLLDSHTAISQASQLRTDSYIYTVEAFKEVRDRLKDDGIISLAFASIGAELDQKLNLMVTSVFNAPPIRIASFYDGEVTLIQSRSGKVAVPESLTPLLKSKYFSLVPEGVNEPTGIELSTDNWPFFYMPHKSFPMSYLPMLVLIVIIALSMLYSLECFNEPTDSITPAFFLLGSGFMLIETKAITELALYFGNTWIVTGITIGAILTMAFVANLIVDKMAPSRPLLPLLGVLGSLGLGLWAHHYLPQSNEHAGALVATLLATLPIAFSGVVFSTLFRSAKSVGMAMSANILGALVGGAMEYFALWLGYEALYVMAIFVYALAALCFLPIKTAAKSVQS